MAKRKGRTKGKPSKKQGGSSNNTTPGKQFRSPRGIDRAVMDEYESLTKGFSKYSDRNGDSNGSHKKRNGHFSMRDEARHTTHSHEIFGSNARQLRHAAPIQFVSAGSYDPSKIQRLDEQVSGDEMLDFDDGIENEEEEDEISDEVEDFEDDDEKNEEEEVDDHDITKLTNGRGLSMQGLHLHGNKSTHANVTNGQNGLVNGDRGHKKQDDGNTLQQQQKRDDLFVVDTVGDAKLATKVQYRPMPPPIVRSRRTSTSSSESEDSEKLVFVPKGKRGVNTLPPPSQKQKTKKGTSKEKEVAVLVDQDVGRDKESVHMDTVVSDLIKDILIEEDVLDDTPAEITLDQSKPPALIVVEDVVMTSAVMRSSEIVEEHTTIQHKATIEESALPALGDVGLRRVTQSDSASVMTKESNSFTSSPRNKKANGRAKKRGKATRKSRQTLEEEEEDAIIADFIENMEENLSDQEELLAFASRELGGDFPMNLDDPLEASTSYSKTVDESTAASRKQFWDYVRDEDTSNVPDILILDKRSGADVVEYYITWEGEPDSAFWIDAASLNNYHAQTVEDYEIQMMSSSSESLSDDEDEDEVSNEDEDEDEDKEMLDEEDEDDDLEGGIPDTESLNGYKTDELLARLIQEQEYAAARGNNDQPKKKTMFAAVGDDEDDGDDEEFDPDDLLAMMSGKQGKRVGKYHSATKLADAFERFESSNPRLGGGRKGKARAVPVFNLSDSEAEATLIERWSNDRKTKRMKKMERELARSQGTLSKSSRMQFLKKYENGMKVEDIHRELKVFLLGDDECLNLVPMLKNDRKQIHVLANLFNLKSKSQGIGMDRYPVLYKTARSGIFLDDEDAIDKLLLHGRHMKPKFGGLGSTPKWARGREGKSGSGKRGGGGGSAGHKHQDGDVVGVGAAEIGSENRGRVMLERMGWSTGSGLGAVGNKGIVAPVAAIVKTSRAGLG